MTKNTNTKKRPRTYARNRAYLSRKGNERTFESDGAYLLKLVISVLLGAFWVKFQEPIAVGGMFFNGIPVGLVVGLVLARLAEPHQLNRKIWYAVLVVVSLLVMWSPIGLFL